MTFSGSRGVSPAPLKPPDITFCKSSSVGGIKGGKELGLRNMGYRASDQMLYFSTIYLFQRPKAPNIKRLK
jgi:hypothetical protein